MSKSNGGVRSKTGGLGRDGGGNYEGSRKNEESLSAISDKKLRLDVQQGISKFESRLGIRQRKVKLAELEGAYGVHVSASDGKGNIVSKGVFLNSNTFKNATREQVIKNQLKTYKSGFLTKTNKPTQHIVVHELAHATWNSHLTGNKYKTAGKEIRALYRQFLKDNPSGFGSYSRYNVNEFFAEGVTKQVLGKSDKYTRTLKKIIKDNNL
jgi:hypothetical protein